MSQRVTAQILKQKYTPPGRDPYFLAELTLLDAGQRQFVRSPLRFPEFKAIADLLYREAGVSHEVLQDAFTVYESRQTAVVDLNLEDVQIAALGFLPVE